MAGTSLKTKTIRVRVPNDQIVEAQELAKFNGEKLSEMVRRWIAAGCEAESLRMKSSQKVH